MQGLITLDFGNTNPHAGLFQKNQGQWELIKVVPWKELQLFLNQLKMTPDNTAIALAQVKSREEELFPLLKQGYLLTRVKDYWRGKAFAGMSVNYSQTLGEDRLVEAYYCFKTNPKPTLLIDAGTYVTMDVISSEGFKGGYIIPGIQSYFQAFSHGEQLKDVKPMPDFSWDIPTTTSKAMSEGYNAFAALAKELVVKHQLQEVILTGGYASTWEGFFKLQSTGAIVHIKEDLVHWALHYWMTTQIEPL